MASAVQSISCEPLFPVLGAYLSDCVQTVPPLVSHHVFPNILLFPKSSPIFQLFQIRPPC